jgi:hypothetical protein
VLYEEQLSLAPLLCLQCATFFVTGEQGPDACPDCGGELEERVYEEWFRHAFYAVRFGYQYRSYNDPAVQADDSSLKPFLPPLNEVFTFMGMAAIGFLNGGATRDRSRDAIRKILQNWNAISSDLEQLSLSDDDVEGFIDCIGSYYQDVAGLKDEITRSGDKGISAEAVTQSLQRSVSRRDKPAARPPVLPSRQHLWSNLAV